MRMVQLVIGVLVAVIVTAAVLVPVVDNVTAERKTYTNPDGIFYMDASDDEVMLTFDPTTGVLISNGSSIAVTSRGGVNIWVTDSYAARTAGNNNIQLFNNLNLAWVYFNNTEVIEFNFADSVCTYSQGDTTGSFRFSSLIYAVPEGQFVWMPYTHDAEYVVTGDSEICGFGPSSINSSRVVFRISGTVSDVTVESDRAVVSNIHVNTHDAGNGLLGFDSITFDAEFDDTTATITFTALAIPVEVVGENPDYVGESAAILAVIPTLVVTAIVVCVAYTVLRGRTD